MKKICFVMPYHILENRGGGAEVQAWLLAKELARREYKVTYIAQRVDNKRGRLQMLGGVAIRWVRYAHYFRWTNGWQYYRALKEANPDIVVQRMTSFMTGVISFYIKKYKKKFVWICTDNESPKKWLFLKSQKKINRESKVNLAKSLIFLFNAFIYDLSRQWGMKRISYAFTQNEFQKKTLKEEFGLESFLMISGHEIPQNITPIEERLANRIVLWVANLGQKKRPEKFIELAKIAEASRLRFIMIGGRDDDAYIKRLFKDKPDNLEWLGRLPFDETLSWFDKAAFFINTSFFEIEGFPNTFIQAWLRGVPVITLGVDPDGIIKKYKLGYVSRDIRGALNYLIYLMNDKVAYIEFSRNASRYAQEKHSISAMTDNFLKLLALNQ
jgi:glycosyltransferase involved in cell wall biosynthesis